MLGREDGLQNLASSMLEQRAQHKLIDFYVDELEHAFGPRVAWEALASVFVNVATRALGAEEAIADLRRMASWLESTDTMLAAPGTHSIHRDRPLTRS